MSHSGFGGFENRNRPCGKAREESGEASWTAGKAQRGAGSNNDSLVYVRLPNTFHFSQRFVDSFYELVVTLMHREQTAQVLAFTPKMLGVYR